MTTADPAVDPKLVALAKNIADLDDLVRMLVKAMPQAKPWQRRLISQLLELERLVQILRMPTQPASRISELLPHRWHTP